MKNTRTKKRAFLELRLNSLMALFFLGFLAVVFRLFQIQVLGDEKLGKMGQDQYWTVQEISAGRGSISSSDGFLLAGTVDNYLMYGEPKVIVDKTRAAVTLSEYLASIEPEPAEAAEDSEKAIKPGVEKKKKKKWFLKIF